MKVPSGAQVSGSAVTVSLGNDHGGSIRHSPGKVLIEKRVGHHIEAGNQFDPLRQSQLHRHIGSSYAADVCY
ncbi:MAG: hypothetical protein ACOY9D_09745 [Pseudomonadota bacterium]